MALGVSQGTASKQLAPVLPDTGYIIARTETPNGAGGRKVEETKGPSIPCGLAPLKGGEYVGARAMPKPAGDRIDARTTHVITFPAETEIDESAEVEIEGKGRFEVTAVRRRSIELLREVEAREKA
jgi:hypothetical protein